MGFLGRNINGEEPKGDADQEEQYEKLFPKIGRDFVYREDLTAFITHIMSLVDPTGTQPFVLGDSSARQKAVEYKGVVEAGLDGSKLYNDLVKIED